MSRHGFSLKAVVLAFRPKTLVAGVAPIVAGTALVYLNGYPILWWVVLCALACTLCLQVATNLFNDAIDFKKGADTNERIGPTRATASGVMSSKSVFFMAFVFVGLAILFGLPLVIQGGALFLGLGFVSVLLAYSYTGGPLPLAYLGLGELFVLLFFGWLAVGGTYFLQTLEFNRDVFVLGLQQGLLATALIVINNARDIHQDKVAKKKTLAVRFGLLFAKLEVVACYLLTILLLTHWYWSGWSWVAILSLAAVFPMVLLLIRLWPEEPSPVYNKFLALAGIIQLFFSILFCIGVWLESLV